MHSRGPSALLNHEGEVATDHGARVVQYFHYKLAATGIGCGQVQLPPHQWRSLWSHRWTGLVDACQLDQMAWVAAFLIRHLDTLDVVAPVDGPVRSNAPHRLFMQPQPRGDQGHPWLPSPLECLVAPAGPEHHQHQLDRQARLHPLRQLQLGEPCCPSAPANADPRAAHAGSRTVIALSLKNRISPLLG